MYDVIIVGGGPAGLVAAAYCLRKRLEVLLIAPELGGKANYRMHLAGLEGFEHITGEEIVRKFRSQLQYLDFARIRDMVVEIEPVEEESGEIFVVMTEKGNSFPTRAVILATGVEPMRLHVPDEELMAGRGLSYSATSHAPLFWEREAAVIGSGDLALRSATELVTIAKRVVLVAPESVPESPLKHKLDSYDNVTLLEKHHVTRLHANGYVHSMTVSDTSGNEQEIPVTGVFVELGLHPYSDLVADLVDLDPERYVIVDDRCHTSRSGIFAAGDVTNTYNEQVLIATGEGAKAALAAYDFLLELDA
ncbi:MAG: NAD(P)/FAD-dependent oxidoreductase [Chloroflexi bacterium]|nr:NAD(P)/FAD-dependent oxidoreductase [Chloroflexota bacterium]